MFKLLFRIFPVAFFLIISANYVEAQLNFSELIQPCNMNSVLMEDGYYVWGGSAVKGDDGLYHLFYARWKKEYFFNGWVTHSQIAHAVSPNPEGPFNFKNIALPARGKEYWDGLCTHNPHIQKYDDRYYLYYMGNTGDGKAMQSLNFIHRNNQRIGVAWSDSPDGPWHRSDQPFVDVSADPNADDALMTSNPSVTKMRNGEYLIVYKAVAKHRPLPFGGPVTHLAAIAETPLGPIKKFNKRIFYKEGEHFPAEDPFIWYSSKDDLYYGIVKDMQGTFTGAGVSLALFTSTDGLEWHPAKNPLASKLQVEWENGKIEKLARLERAQILFEKGEPIMLYCASTRSDPFTSETFNIHIPLRSIKRVNKLELFVSPEGAEENCGNFEQPLTFESAIKNASDYLKAYGLPVEGIEIKLIGGTYHFEKPLVLGAEFLGTVDKPIIIKAIEGEKVLFDGGKLVPSNTFEKISSEEEIKRLSVKSADKVFAATIREQTLIDRFNDKLMLNLSINDEDFLPSVFPNEGYANFKNDPVTPEVCPPGISIGEQDYGIRAGSPPHQEKGKTQGWKGTLNDPRGARAGIAEQEYNMAGTWDQWEKEIRRNNTRNQLTGYIEANWLLSSQAIYSASGKDECIHLSRVLGYGWAWRNKDKPFRVFGLLCELDKPGEWHFDPLSNRLFLYPPAPLNEKSEISLSVAMGFLDLHNCSQVQVIGLSVKNVGGKSVYRINGNNNMIASCTISNCTATGIEISGSDNTVEGCDLYDLNSHIRLSGGKRSPEEITSGNNRVENCHIYQKNFKHEKVNIGMSGVGNIFRNNLVHNSLGQAMTVNGNDHLIELNEFFNIGYDEGDGGAIYSGADLGGFGNTYRYNFFHHLMHVPGKVERSGIHLDDGQSGATCIGNIFYKSAAKGVFAFGGAAHTFKYNVFLEGFRGIYIDESLGKKSYDIHKAIEKDPNHMYKNTKENYIGRLEKIIGEKGWEKYPWKEKYPKFYEVMSDTAIYGRLWPIRYHIEANYFYNNTKGDHTIKKVSPEAWSKNIVEDELLISPGDFVDYEKMDFRFKNPDIFPDIPFNTIGLKINQYRKSMPDKQSYRIAIKDFFNGISSMPGTELKYDSSKLMIMK